MTADADLIHAVRQSLFERGPYISEKEAQRVIADVGQQLAAKLETYATEHWDPVSGSYGGDDQPYDPAERVREWTGASHLPEDR